MDFLSYHFIDFKGFKLSLLSIIWLVFIYIGVWVILRLIKVFIHRRFVKRNIIDKAREFTIYSLIRYLVFTFSLFVMLGTVGVKFSWLFGAGIPLLVGIGLGLQGLFKDFVAGIVLSIEGSFKVGDIIEIDKTMAQVKNIDLRTSKVETGDGVQIIVPNSQLTDGRIINWSHTRKEIRSTITITLAYGTDAAMARHLLYQVLIANPSVSKVRKPNIQFTDFSSHGMTFKLAFWTAEPWDVEQVKSDLRFAIETALRARDIRIPYPQLDIRMTDNRIYEDRTSRRDPRDQNLD
ncbi:MAG: mechanosensitive ion channel domain-containing protein [Bacteroidota bacterium]